MIDLKRGGLIVVYSTHLVDCAEKNPMVRMEDSGRCNPELVISPAPYFGDQAGMTLSPAM
jgi:hypothetical protein